MSAIITLLVVLCILFLLQFIGVAPGLHLGR